MAAGLTYPHAQPSQQAKERPYLNPSVVSPGCVIQSQRFVSKSPNTTS